MNSTIDSYFATVKQIATERGATYSHGTTWAAADSTRNGERVVVEVSFTTVRTGRTTSEKSSSTTGILPST